MAASSMARAQEAAFAAKPAIALDLLERAQRLDPTLPELPERLGQALVTLGRHDEAIMAFEKAIPSPDGEPEILAAESSLALGDMAQAETYVLLALAAPSLLVDILIALETAPPFATLRERPAIRNAMETAGARFDPRGEPGDTR